MAARRTLCAASTNSYKYRGREEDGTGLAYYRTRYYHPRLQRFISEDPIGLAGGINQYAYVGNQPLRYTDSSGLFADAFLDVGFILYDVYQLATSGRKDLGPNLAALGADVLGALTPGATGLGLGVREVRATERAHFLSHGDDFGAASADDYVRQASEFLQNSQRQNLPTKLDPDGTIRIWDPQTNTFGAYNADGSLRTFFKPTSPTYFDRQPGTAPWILGGR